MRITFKQRIDLTTYFFIKQLTPLIKQIDQCKVHFRKAQKQKQNNSSEFIAELFTQRVLTLLLSERQYKSLKHHQVLY